VEINTQHPLIYVSIPSHSTVSKITKEIA
jgi:hypothetical protein